MENNCIRMSTEESKKIYKKMQPETLEIKNNGCGTAPGNLKNGSFGGMKTAP
jgi:hypothetical protein